MTFKKVDANQPKIVKGLRDAGFEVDHTYMIGKGVPDIIICKEGGFPVWVEIKNPETAWSLTEDEEKWHKNHKYTPVIICETLQQVLDLYDDAYSHFIFEYENLHGAYDI